MERVRTRVFRFGAYELDASTGELLKHGLKVRLQEQPFQILLMLLEHPGEAVFRHEIRKQLWPDNTIVEFDHSINAAIKRLRDVLGDSADNPRYVETVERRGYRFLGHVEIVPSGLPDPFDAAVSERPAHSNRLVAAALIVAVFLVGAVTSVLFTIRWDPPTDAAMHVRPLTNYPGGQYEPAFSPDGSQMAFVWNGDKQDNFDIYVKFMDSGTPLRLTTNLAGEGSPAWSPDGQRIAFFRYSIKPMNLGFTSFRRSVDRNEESARRLRCRTFLIVTWIGRQMAGSWPWPIRQIPPALSEFFCSRLKPASVTGSRRRQPRLPATLAPRSRRTDERSRSGVRLTQVSTTFTPFRSWVVNRSD